MIRFRLWFSFTERNGTLHASGTRSNDCYQLRMLASSFMTNAGPAARKANILRISIHSQMTPWPPCGKPGELLVRAAPGLDIRVAVRAAGSHRSPQHERPPI